MPVYVIRYSASLHGETTVEASDIREAIETLDEDYFPQKVTDDSVISSYYIESVDEI